MERGSEPWEGGWLMATLEGGPYHHPDEADGMLWGTPWNSTAKALVV